MIVCLPSPVAGVDELLVFARGAVVVRDVLVGFGLADDEYLFDSVPEQKRFAIHGAFHNVLTAVGVFAGAVAGWLIPHHFRRRSRCSRAYSWLDTLYGCF